MKDMTQGKPFRVLLLFAVPMLLSATLQQFYNIADSMIAGRFAGSDALAAVGASYPITVLFLAVASGASLGSSVVISQIFGARDFERLKSAVTTAILALAVIGTVLTAAGLIFCDPLMRLINTPEEIFSSSALYLRIYCLGVLFLFAYNGATAIFNGLGDSRTPLFFLLFSSVANIALDLLFVIRFHMGVAGVAWATFIAQGISSLLAVCFLIFRLRNLKAENRCPVFRKDLLLMMGGIAVPSIMQQSFISVGQLCVQGLINSFGKNTVAGFSAAFKINTFAVTCIITIGSALSSFAAQNIGAGKPERVRFGYHAALALATIFSVSIASLVLLNLNTILSLFVNESASKEVLETGALFLMTVMPFHLSVMAKTVTDGVLRGAGDMKSFMFSTFSDLIIRVAVSYLLVPVIGFLGICLSFPIGWLIGMAFSLLFYLKGSWKKQGSFKKMEM